MINPKRIGCAIIAGFVILGDITGASFAGPPTSAGPFKHPGMLNDLDELNSIKDKIHANAEPWKTAFSKIESSGYGSLKWSPKPRPIVEVGFFNKPDRGGTDELKDATASYVHALIWVFTGQEEHARKASEILNAWSAVLQNHTGDNAKLQAAWAGCVFPLSAEILRSTYPEWTSRASTDLSAMFKRAFVPLIISGMPLYNGNWELSMANALIAIGVFNDERATFDEGVLLWRTRVPAYFYLSQDGPFPVKPYRVIIMGMNSYWGNPGEFVDGLCQETSRDFGHVQMGLAATINAAEIAYHQGLDLYSEESTRITAAMEFHANYLLGNPVPSWLCGGKLNIGTGTAATWETAYNHFHNRMGMALPMTRRIIDEKVRRLPHISLLNAVGIDTLTHAELGR